MYARVITIHVDDATIFRIVLKGLAIEHIIISLALIRLTDDTPFAATENLEGVALFQVDGRAAPYLGVLTIAATEHVQGCTKHVHALLVEDDTRVALGYLVTVVVVEFRLTALRIQFYNVED